jgi:hypothetical protein
MIMQPAQSANIGRPKSWCPGGVREVLYFEVSNSLNQQGSIVGQKKVCRRLGGGMVQLWYSPGTLSSLGTSSGENHFALFIDSDIAKLKSAEISARRMKIMGDRCFCFSDMQLHNTVKVAIPAG